jgi:hypothetical protein
VCDMFVGNEKNRRGTKESLCNPAKEVCPSSLHGRHFEKRDSISIGNFQHYFCVYEEGKLYWYPFISKQ